QVAIRSAMRAFFSAGSRFGSISTQTLRAWPKSLCPWACTAASNDFSAESRFIVSFSASIELSSALASACEPWLYACRASSATWVIVFVATGVTGVIGLADTGVTGVLGLAVTGLSGVVGLADTGLTGVLG